MPLASTATQPRYLMVPGLPINKSRPSGPIVETVWDELLFNETEAKQARLTYKATSTDQAERIRGQACDRCTTR